MRRVYNNIARGVTPFSMQMEKGEGGDEAPPEYPKTSKLYREEMPSSTLHLPWKAFRASAKSAGEAG